MTDGALTGKVAVVTGAASGIGRGGAEKFAAAGASVVVADVNADGAAETVSIIEAAGGAAVAVTCDVTDETQVEQMVAACIDSFGRLDVAFNNAGAAMSEFPIHEMSAQHWRDSIEVNLTGTFLCLKHEVRHFLDHGGGCIVNTSSGAARVPAPGRAPYSAAKRGVVALTAHVAGDYGKAGVRANAVLPGLVDTPGLRTNFANSEDLDNLARFMPGGVLGQPADVADVAVWLCTDEARYVNGQAIVVDGGGILS